MGVQSGQILVKERDQEVKESAKILSQVVPTRARGPHRPHRSGKVIFCSFPHGVQVGLCIVSMEP